MTEPIQQDQRFEQKVAALEDYYNLGSLKPGEYRQLRSVVEKPAEVLDSTERTINSLLEDLLNRTIDFDYFYNSYKLLSPRLPAPPPVDSAQAVNPDDVEVSPRRRLATPIPPRAIATGAVALILLLIIAYFFLKPSAPGKLAVVSVSSRHVGLAWEDQSNIERGFSLERNDGGNTKFVTIATPPENAAAYIDSTVQPLTIYAYRLRSYNRMGFSRFSNHTITFTAAPSNPPDSPSQLRANPASASQIDLYWIDNSNDEEGFVIERSPSMTANFAEVTSTAANLTIYRDRGLTPDTQYYFRVSAKNAAGASLPSNVINAQTYPAPDRAPEAPTGVQVINATPAQVVLQWHDASLNEEEFQIERGALTDSNFSRIASEGAGIFRFVDTGVSPDTRYLYRVRAVNRAGRSPYSETVAANTPLLPSNPPAAPEELVVVNNATGIRLTWKDNSVDEESFQIERSSDGGVAFTQIAQVLMNNASFVDTTAAPGATYSYRVSAHNGAGQSEFSNVAEIIVSELPQGPPASPPRRIAATARSMSSIRLVWEPPVDADEIRIERSSKRDGEYQNIATVSIRQDTLVDEQLKPATTYYYRLSSRNRNGSSVNSQAVSATTRQPPSPPERPTNLVVNQISTTQVDLAWRDNSNTETGHQIERRNPDSKSFVVIGNTEGGVTKFRDSKLKAESTYQYRVRASNQTGNSPYSNEATITTSRYQVLRRSGAEIVADMSTGLMWQRSGSGDFMSYTEAASYIANLNQSSHGGYNDWRLPTSQEAATILQSSPSTSGLYLSAVFDTTQRWVWTSTASGQGMIARVVNFSTGESNVAATLTTHLNYVRAVRGTRR